MANLIICRTCDMSCPYCFAAELIHSHRQQDRFVSLETFTNWLDFLAASAIDEIRLIGGEPTLHPQFADLLQLARERKRRILIFTHGWLQPHIVQLLESIPETEVRLMVNMNAKPAARSRHTNVTIQRDLTLQRLGKRASLGYNIYQPDFDLAPLIDVIRRTRIRPTIRLGLAQPVWGGNNIHLHPKQYSTVGHRLAMFGRLAHNAGVKLEFDCGFVPCMFTDRERQALQQQHPDLGWHCNPVLDLDIDDTALHCFPLSQKVYTSRQAEETAADIRKRLSTQAEPYRRAGIYRKCSTCDWKRSGDCPGGCLSTTLNRYRPATSHLIVPEYVKGSLDPSEI